MIEFLKRLLLWDIFFGPENIFEQGDDLAQEIFADNDPIYDVEPSPADENFCMNEDVTL